MFVVDTNILVDAANEAAELHTVARDRLDRWRRQSTPWYITWSVCYEFIRVVTHLRVLRRPWAAAPAFGFIEALLAAPAVSVLTHTPRHAAVLGEIVRELRGIRGNVMHDVHTAALMREHGIKTIYTRDTDFHRFPFLEVIDPLRQS